MSKSIKLSFVNEGKEFVIPTITVGMQEKLMEQMVKLDKEKIGETAYNSKMNKILLLDVLHKIDPKVTEEHLNNMHPEDFMYLFNQIWEGGRELTSSEENFRKTK